MAQPPSQGHVCLMNVAACVTTSGVRGESVKSVSSFSKVRTHYNDKTRQAPVMLLMFCFVFSCTKKKISEAPRPLGFCCGKSDFLFVPVAVPLQIN